MPIRHLLLTVVLGLLALNGLAYGAFYLFSPAAGLGEFGYDTTLEAEAGALHLVSLAGITLLGFAGFALLAIRYIARGVRAGLGVAHVLGGIYLGLGAYAVSAQLWVDALIYGGFGLLVTLLAAIGWQSMPPTRSGARQ